MNHRNELRRILQSTLIAMGHDLGPSGADGRMGPFTAQALRRASTERFADGDLLRVLQSTLIVLGYDLGPTGADGRMGPFTREALVAAAGSWRQIEECPCDIVWAPRCRVYAGWLGHV